MIPRNSAARRLGLRRLDGCAMDARARTIPHTRTGFACPPGRSNEIRVISSRRQRRCAGVRGEDRPGVRRGDYFRNTKRHRRRRHHDMHDVEGQRRRVAQQNAITAANDRVVRSSGRNGNFAAGGALRRTIAHAGHRSDTLRRHDRTRNHRHDHNEGHGKHCQPSNAMPSRCSPEVQNAAVRNRYGTHDSRKSYASSGKPAESCIHDRPAPSCARHALPLNTTVLLGWPQ